MDGSIRATCFDIDENDWNGSSIKTIQHSKPHLGQVKQILTNKNLMVSASEDQTIFIYKISSSPNGIRLTPVGFIQINATIQRIGCFDFDEDKVNNELETHGFILHISLYSKLIVNISIANAHHCK